MKAQLQIFFPNTVIPRLVRMRAIKLMSFSGFLQIERAKIDQSVDFLGILEQGSLDLK